METITVENEMIMFTAKSSDVDSYLTDFHKYQCKTAEGILDMAYIVHQASQHLAPIYYAEFKKRIHFDAGSSSFVKLEKIGEKVGLLKRYADKLPNTWTTIYYLARLTETVFEEFVDKGRIWPGMKGADAQSLVNPDRTTNPKSKKVVSNVAQVASVVESRELSINFPFTPTADALRAVYEEMRALLARVSLEAELKLSPSLETILFGNEGETV